MKKRSRIFVITLLLLVMFAQQAEAKKPNYKKIYGKILKKNSITTKENGYSYTYSPLDAFVLLDINRDGKKELIIQTGWYRSCFVYTIKGKKAKLVDHVFCFFSQDPYDKKHRYFVEYNKKYKGLILHQHGGTGLAGLDLYKMKKKGLTRIVSIESSSLWEDGGVVTRYTKNYWSYYNKYFKAAKKKYMYENTKKNRAKYLK